MTKFEVEISNDLLEIMKKKQHKEHWEDVGFLQEAIEKLMNDQVWFEAFTGIIEVKKVTN